MVHFLPKQLPMRYAIDFETASDVDLRVVGAWAYAAHPSTSILMMAYRRVDQEGATRIWLPGDAWPLPDNVEIVAHNAEFEFAIWNTILVEYVGPLLPEQTHDLMALAAYAGFPRSLAELGAALRLKQQKLDNRLVSKFSTYSWTAESHPEDWKAFIEYCQRDVDTLIEAYRLLPELPDFEREIFVEHLAINQTGINVDIASVQKLNAIRALAEERLKATPEGELLSRPTALVTWLSVLGADVPDARANTLEAAIATASPKAQLLIAQRLAFAKTSTKKLKRALQANVNGVLKGMHVYYGAHTGRFSGALVQPHNLPRACVRDIDGNFALLDCLPDDPVDLLGGPEATINWISEMVRPCFTAPPGQLLAGADFTAIEACILAWLFGAEALQEQFRAGTDVYKTMASIIYNLPVTAIEDDSHERFISKQVVLGCGYGMGWRKFIIYCLMVAKVLLSEDEAKNAVQTYRKANPEIPDGWRTLDRAVQELVALPDEARYLFEQKLIMWTARGPDGQASVLLCRLPSGRIIRWLFPRYVRIPGQEAEASDEYVLTYLTPQKSGNAGASIAAVIKAREGDASYLNELTGLPALDGMIRVTSWGGKLTENIVQAISRDLLAQAFVRVKQAGYQVGLHVHDELIAFVDNQEQAQEVWDVMQETPNWANGAVIRVKGWCGFRYRKG